LPFFRLMADEPDSATPHSPPSAEWMSPPFEQGILTSFSLFTGAEPRAGFLAVRTISVFPQCFLRRPFHLFSRRVEGGREWFSSLWVDAFSNLNFTVPLLLFLFFHRFWSLTCLKWKGTLSSISTSATLHVFLVCPKDVPINLPPFLHLPR